RNRETVSTSTGKSRKRSRKVAPCCCASTVVGTSTSTWPPPDTHFIGARTALHPPPRGHRGLAEADVAADQPVHRLLSLHVLGDGVDGALLVVGLLIGERLLQPGGPLVVTGERRPAGRLAPRVQRQQLAGQLAHRVSRPRLERVPGLASQPRQRRRGAVRPDVAADLAQLLVGYVETVVAAELQVQVVAH